MMSDTKTYEDGYEDGYNAGVADAKAEAFGRKDGLAVVDAVLKDFERSADKFVKGVREVSGPATGMSDDEIFVVTSTVDVFSKMWVAEYRRQLKEKYGESDE